MRLAKYFALAFFGQIVVNAILLVLFEITGFSLLMSIPFWLYIFVADRIAFYWTGLQKGADSAVVVAALLIPLAVYSLCITVSIALWKRYVGPDRIEKS